MDFRNGGLAARFFISDSAWIDWHSILIVHFDSSHTRPAGRRPTAQTTIGTGVKAASAGHIASRERAKRVGQSPSAV